MQEPAMTFDGIELSPQKEIVRIFYKDLWDHADKSLIPQIFHPGFTFRGSLGPVLTGHDEFAGYVDMVTGALGDYTSDILEMVEEGNKVFGKLRFHGVHRKELLGCCPDRQACVVVRRPALYLRGGKVRDLWVLGDVHGLMERLK